MPRSIVLMTLVLGLAATAPEVRAQAPGAARDARIAVGQPFPALAGDYLSGGDARLPRDVAGQVAILALGFSYESRMPVEAWMSVVRNRLGTRAGVTWLQIPMIGGAGRLARPFINRGMRRDTPPNDRRHVVTVYGVGDWKRRLGVRDETAAYLVLLDRAGIVRWLATARTVSPQLVDELMQVIDRQLEEPPG